MGKRSNFTPMNRFHEIIDHYGLKLMEVRITNDDGKKMRKLLEVDFICNSGDKRVYIQSALDMPTQEKIDQETNSLRHIKDGFPKIVIVGGLTPSHVNTDGI